jgi:serine O-acetyltransferase
MRRMPDVPKKPETITPEAGIQRWKAAILESVVSNGESHRTANSPMPDAAIVGVIVERLRWLAFPGFFGPRVVDPSDLEEHVGRLIDELAILLFGQLEAAFAYDPIGSHGCQASEAYRRASEALEVFLERIPAVRSLLAEDALAAYEGDPAMHHLDEAILCCPGVAALVVHRFAHELQLRGVPLIPRMMSEISHAATGIDIHPGAMIGRQMFIDHGTGVVIGETTRIGDRCRLYQGVTLGAKRLEVDETGRIRRGYQRHPTIEDDVTIYAGATILGEDTVIGRGSVVNGSVFVTSSVPAGSVVSGPNLEIRMRKR